jgi:hypothetical protein
MVFNKMGFVISDIVARNNGAPPATALRDGLLGGVMGSTLLGVILASVISRNQGSPGTGASALSSAPVVTAVAIMSDEEPHVLLTWSAMSNATSYTVHRHATGQSAKVIPDLLVAAYDDDDVESDKTYHYSVDALDDNEKIIAKSATVRVKTPEA